MQKFTRIYRMLMALCCLTLISCDDLITQGGNSCGDIGPYPIALDIIDIELSPGIQLYFQEDLTYPTYNSFESLYLAGDNIAYDSLVLSLDATTQDIFAQHNKNTPFQLSPFSKAYACSLALPAPQEKIIDITITSANAFNDDTPAGSSLTAFFDVIYADTTYATDFYSRVNDELAYFSVEEYMQQTDVYANKAMQLRLNTAPEFLTNQQFFITIHLDSGEVFILESPEINFTAP